MADGVAVRAARRDDAAALTTLIEALNRHEEDPVEHMTLEHVQADLFGVEPWLEGVIAERDGEAVGYALFHRTYETAYAARGLYVQDLFVSEGARGRGVGGALVTAVTRRAIELGASFLWWTSKSWNRSAHAAYAAWGATDEVVHAHALFGPPFDRMAKGNARSPGHLRATTRE